MHSSQTASCCAIDEGKRTMMNLQRRILHLSIAIFCTVLGVTVNSLLSGITLFSAQEQFDNSLAIPLETQPDSPLHILWIKDSSSNSEPGSFCLMLQNISSKAVKDYFVSYSVSRDADEISTGSLGSENDKMQPGQAKLITVKINRSEKITRIRV